ncbi:MAG TPA: carboxylating nicotinate-nucleotide diphosphorylase [Candidatus Omnitrophota bacterium]|nr:carboxylating nicotinate-nucleotide diphosphorylase [Candidatus Omnitrophota bacterium]
MKELVKKALREDIGTGDITSKLVIAEKLKATAVIKAKEPGVIAGLEVAAEVFRQVDRRIKLTKKIRDGEKIARGQALATVSGPARGILTGERTALNFLQHLSGIATLTARFVSRAGRATVLDTRKTVPGMRALEKYAVKTGGGTNHRMGLYDAVLIKDNHIKLAGGIREAVARAKGKKVEVETKDLAEVREAIDAGASRILLDNMDTGTMKKAVKLCRAAEIKTEASGGVDLKNISTIARTGVDYISIGALTHSSKALDINLKIF